MSGQNLQTAVPVGLAKRTHRLRGRQHLLWVMSVRFPAKTTQFYMQLNWQEQDAGLSAAIVPNVMFITIETIWCKGFIPGTSQHEGGKGCTAKHDICREFTNEQIWDC